MAKLIEEIDARLATWIEERPIWFVATAPLAPDGHVNVSPRGHDTLSVLGPKQIAWVDLTGSGIETIAHLKENGRICLMFLSFEKRPRIVRIHGRGRVIAPGEPGFDEVVARHPSNASTRAVITVDAERISDSCGWGVPVMEVLDDRDIIRMHAEKKGPEKMDAYRRLENSFSIDGLPGL